jgi:hypothetical protein
MKKNIITAAAILAFSAAAFAVDGEYLSNFDLLWDRTPKA